jgi:gag-polypeptide of LTR copia-type
MNSTEGVSDYITRVQTVSNQLKRNGENLSEQRVLEKILRSLIDTFEDVVYAIDESKDLAELTVDELAGSLLAHEQRKKLKKKESLEEALQTKVVLKKKALYMHMAQQTRSRGGHGRRGRGESSQQSGQLSSNSPRRGSRNSNNRRKPDVECYNCGKHRHIARDC